MMDPEQHLTDYEMREELSSPASKPDLGWGGVVPHEWQPDLSRLVLLMTGSMC
jgi:hypothetical protein